MTRNKNAIGVLPVGFVPDLVLSIIVSNIEAYLKLTPEIVPPFDPPVMAYNNNRGQFDAGKMIQAFSELDLQQYGKVIAVFMEDLFVPIVTHVYGEAQQGGKFAIISLFRLAPNPSRVNSNPSSTLYERAVKIALHEIGHLYNLLHCEDTKCLMHFSDSLEDLDATPIFFCRYCHRYFQTALIH
jgi:archaemetzincin